MKYLLEKVWKGWNWKWSLKWRKKSASLPGGKYGHSELARYPKSVWINNRAAILSWCDGCEGAMTQGKPPKEWVPTPARHGLRGLVDVCQSRRVNNVISGGNISSGLWYVCALKPQHLLALIIFHLTLLLQMLSSIIWMPNLSKPS